MLTAGNVSDIKAAPALIERAARMRYLLADKGYDADRLRRSLRHATPEPFPSSRDGATGNAPSDTTRSATVAGTSSKTPSAASRTFDASQPATTSSPQTSCQASPSLPRSPSGSD